MGVPAQVLPRNLIPRQGAWRRPVFVREVGPQGYLFRTPYGVRGMSVLRSSVRRGTQLCDTLLQGSQLCDTLLQGSQFCDTTAYREAIRQASQFCDAFYMDHNSVIIVAIGRQVYRVITLVLPITQRAKNDTTI